MQRGVSKIMARFTITLPETVASKLAADEERLKIPRSTLIAEYLREHYNAVPTAQYEAQVQKLESQAREYERIIQDLQTEATEQIARARKEALEEAASEIQHLKGTLNQQASQSAVQMQQVRMDATKNAASQDLVIKGLQNELEVTKTQTKSLEEKLVIYTGLNNDLKADKENLQKQLELVTLRLPAPKVGFWARLFGGGKKEG